MKTPRTPRTSKHPRQGAVLVLMAMALAALLTVIAVSLNISWFQLKETQAQAAADLAAISALRHRIEGMDTARDIRESRDLGAEILALNENIPGETSRVRFGYLQSPNVHDPVFTEGDTAIAAVQINRSVSAASNVPVFLGALLSQNQQLISAESVTAYPPIEVVLCIDASRSMNQQVASSLGAGASVNAGNYDLHSPPQPGSRWFAMMHATESFLDTVRAKNPNTRLALVTFGGGLPHDSVHSPLDADYSRIETHFDSVRKDKIPPVLDSYITYPALGFGTFIYDAIDDCMDLMDNFSNSRAQRFIILLSDGEQYTTPETRPEPYVAAGRAQLAGIPIHTINFRDVSNASLVRVANTTGGDAFDAVTQQDLNLVFEALLEKFSVHLKR